MEQITDFISKHPTLSAAAIGIFLLVALIELLRAKRNVTTIDATQATHMINREKAIVMDLRPHTSFKKGHIVNAQSVDLKDVEQSKKLDRFKNKPIILVCEQGQNSQKMAADLLKRGYNTYSLKGGMRGWINAQMPIVKE